MRATIGTMIIIMGLYCYGCIPSLMDSVRTPSERYITSINKMLKEANEYRHLQLLDAGQLFKLGKITVYDKNQFIIMGDNLQFSINVLTDALMEFKIYRNREKKVDVEIAVNNYELSYAAFRNVVAEAYYED